MKKLMFRLAFAVGLVLTLAESVLAEMPKRY